MKSFNDFDFSGLISNAKNQFV